MSVLKVVVSTHCFGCEKAIRLSMIAAERFPNISVDVVNLEKQLDAKPSQIVAVPAYLLDGKLIFLGNPREEELFSVIAKQSNAFGQG